MKPNEYEYFKKKKKKGGGQIDITGKKQQLAGLLRLHRALCSLGIMGGDTYADELNRPCNRKASPVHHEWYRGRNDQDP